jgi:FdrA protein
MISYVYSNAPWGDNHQLKSALQSEKHTLIDMGADEFTVGRLHPMIDYSLRNKRIIQEANDSETAVILLDLVLGYGVIENPLDEIVPAIKEAQKTAKDNGRHLPIICSVTGTDGDPQNRWMVMQELQDAGVMVMESNAAACKLAGFIIKELAQR